MRVTTHQQLDSIRHVGVLLERQNDIRTFNEGMRAWFEAGQCGHSHVVRRCINL